MESQTNKQDANFKQNGMETQIGILNIILLPSTVTRQVYNIIFKYNIYSVFSFSLDGGPLL